MAKKFVVQLTYKDVDTFSGKRIEQKGGFKTLQAASDWLDQQMKKDSTIRMGEVL